MQSLHAYLSDYNLAIYAQNNNLRPKQLVLLYVNEHGLLKQTPVISAPKPNGENMMGVIFDEEAFCLGVYVNGVQVNATELRSQFTPKELYFMNLNSKTPVPLPFAPELLTEQDFRPRGSVLLMPYIMP
ncbi:hypothetical protein SAMN05444377_10490 [Flavobacterium fontis]|uniref:Uncharacterized protein n=1 Tax=Flavobacterium fontis TaxID=1124188 RepID=A0A1M4Z9C1_9FLAO|nr:hypothetical protein [Flavobacterium fontis]SHF14192.1 hypothetical protein SAMN05444377_10478 [Flavobacterium fontis]SHF14538.1 hypothetical protein SAMN05444377_10490 [Flavobacterium fontis]